MSNETVLLARIEALQQRVEQLEAKGKPSAPMRAEPAPMRDLTAGMSMPPQALAEMVNAVPDAMVRQIVNGNRAPSDLAPLSGGNAGTVRVARQNRSGWHNPSPLEPPPGIALADKIMDVADARDRAELIEREAKRLATIKAKPDAAA